MFTSMHIFYERNSTRNDHKKVQLLRINLRNKANILELPNQIFLKNFRLNKETFVYVLGLLGLPPGIRSTHIPPMLQLAATLNLLGGGGYQRQVGADWAAPMGQSTVAEISASVIKKMQSVLCPLLIKFEPLDSTKEYFYEKYKIPGVIGCIDGSHIMILRPTENENMFFNRKGRHSINAMIICDEKTKIMTVNARFGGSAHDSFVWRQSEERATLERNFLSGNRSSWLLGDSGYPLEPFLLTPYRNANENSRELNYNFIHSQARSIVERCIGRLKSRWRITLEERKLRYKPARVVEIINVCAALHNICCTRNVPQPEPETNNIIQNHGLQVQPAGYNSNTEAKRIRDGIRDDLFSNNQLGII